MPLIGIWLRAEYEKVKSLESMINLTHKWFLEADSTSNPIRKQCFYAAAQYLYTTITGMSYESKLNIL
jgi:hypothetical protein